MSNWATQEAVIDGTPTALAAIRTALTEPTDPRYPTMGGAGWRVTRDLGDRLFVRLGATRRATASVDALVALTAALPLNIAVATVDEALAGPAWAVCTDGEVVRVVDADTDALHEDVLRHALGVPRPFPAPIAPATPDDSYFDAYADALVEVEQECFDVFADEMCAALDALRTLAR